MAWMQSRIQVTKFFLGLLASPIAGGSGFIQADDLKSQVLPTVKLSTKYGVVMLWSRYYDVQNEYSKDIVSSVCIDENLLGDCYHDCL
ncbi:hypothetical protein HPP92_002979 [Vanilla planifolia]|uniref:Uncharacterized protein n=1 Tax=Vanilla planifolia TaxID=51239 RepID=A0A835SFL4_VANPL|nr:hypothetical protein HPP92_002979 [Vanilla planifolia]